MIQLLKYILLIIEADFKVQSMLIKGIKKHFPELLIIGE